METYRYYRENYPTIRITHRPLSEILQDLVKGKFITTAEKKLVSKYNEQQRLKNINLRKNRKK